MESKFEGRRKAGRPVLRWIDGVLEDLSRLRVKGWWNVAKDRDAWRRILREAEAQSGLWS